MHSLPQDTEKVYRLADLDQWPVSPGLVSLAILGHPVAHSLSPAMHNAALKELAKSAARFHGWRYYKFDIAPEELAQALPLFLQKGFAGLNLTVPLKVDVLKILGSENASEGVLKSGAANTLIACEEKWLLANTDIGGLETAVKQTLKISIPSRPCVILGTGGAARAAITSMASVLCPLIEIRSRTPERAAAFLDDLKKLGFSNVKSAAQDAPLPKGALVINATPLGLKTGDPSPLNPALLKDGMAVFDTTYAPAPSALLKAAAAKNLPHSDGLPMLAAQGYHALNLWLENRLRFHLDDIFMERMLAAACLALKQKTT